MQQIDILISPNVNTESILKMFFIKMNAYSGVITFLKNNIAAKIVFQIAFAFLHDKFYVAKCYFTLETRKSYSEAIAPINVSKFTW